MNESTPPGKNKTIIALYESSFRYLSFAVSERALVDWDSYELVNELEKNCCEDDLVIPVLATTFDEWNSGEAEINCCASRSLLSSPVDSESKAVVIFEMADGLNLPAVSKVAVLKTFS